jgi:hypothetical protein
MKLIYAAALKRQSLVLMDCGKRFVTIIFTMVRNESTSWALSFSLTGNNHWVSFFVALFDGMQQV